MPSPRLRVALFLPLVMACPRTAPAFVLQATAPVAAVLAEGTDRSPLLLGDEARDVLARARSQGAVGTQLVGYSTTLGLFDDARPTHTLSLTWVEDRTGPALVEILRGPGAFTEGSPIRSLVREAREAATPLADLAQTLVGPDCSEIPVATPRQLERLGLPLGEPELARIGETRHALELLCTALDGHPTDDLNVRVDSITWAAKDRRGASVGLLIAHPVLSRMRLTIPTMRFEELP